MAAAAEAGAAAMPRSDFEQKYEILCHIGSGSYSDVVKCRERTTYDEYAVKQLRAPFKDWDAVNANIEIKTLREIPRHPNILRLIEVHFDPKFGHVSLVTDLMDTDLFDFMKSRKTAIPELRVQKIMVQILRGVEQLHKFGVFHRDIKPENILMRYAYPDIIILGDLGSVIGIHGTPPFTQYIATRWYRAPECMLTVGFYGPGVDVWAIGCIFYELLTLIPLFPGISEVDTINKIHDLIGPPSASLLQKYFRLLPNSCSSDTHRVRDLRKMLEGKSQNFNWFASPNGQTPRLNALLENVSTGGKAVMNMMLEYDPERRPTITELLRHEYFIKFQNEDFGMDYGPVSDTAIAPVRSSSKAKAVSKTHPSVEESDLSSSKKVSTPKKKTPGVIKSGSAKGMSRSRGQKKNKVHFQDETFGINYDGPMSDTEIAAVRSLSIVLSKMHPLVEESNQNPTSASATRDSSDSDLSASKKLLTPKKKPSGVTKIVPTKGMSRSRCPKKNLMKIETFGINSGGVSRVSDSEIPPVRSMSIAAESKQNRSATRDNTTTVLGTSKKLLLPKKKPLGVVTKDAPTKGLSRSLKKNMPHLNI